MWAMLSFILECGISTAGNCTRLALRMRVSMSEMVSVIKLPTGLGHAGDQPVQRGLAESQPRAIELAQIAAAAAAHRAPIHHSGRAGVAREFGETGVIALGLQFRAQGGVFLDRFDLFLVAFFPGCFCLKIIFLRRRACPSASTGPAPPRPSARWSQS